MLNERYSKHIDVIIQFGKSEIELIVKIGKNRLGA